MGQLSGSSGIGVQGPGRPANSLLQQGVNMSSSTYNPSGDLLAMLSRGILNPRSSTLMLDMYYLVYSFTYLFPICFCLFPLHATFYFQCAV
jgi:hypothetical protein